MWPNSFNIFSVIDRARSSATDRIMREKANDVGEKIRRENGPRDALNFMCASPLRSSSGLSDILHHLSYDHIHLAQERADLRAQRARGGRADKLSAACVIGRTLSRSGTKRSQTPTRASTLPIPSGMVGAVIQPAGRTNTVESAP